MMATQGTGPYRNEYQYDGGVLYVTNEMRHAFRDTGFVVIRGLFDQEEMGQINKSLEHYTDVFKQHAYQVPDKHGQGTNFMLWHYPENDVIGMIPRCKKVVSTSEQLMGGDEMYHFESKLSMKAPKTGGSFEWHQDYGYWYQDGILKDELNSVFIALDQCTKLSGGLQVLVGSHKSGRVDHGFVGGQQGADPERMEHLKKIYDLFFVELQAGDAVFFHSNLLHCSAPNESDHKRWALISAFNKKTNTGTVYKFNCDSYTPIQKVSNSAVKTCTVFCDPEGKDFLNPSQDSLVNHANYSA